MNSTTENKAKPQHGELKPLRNLAEECHHLRKNAAFLVLFFSRLDCKFCREVRRNYLQALVRETTENVLVVRELESDTVLQVIDHEGQKLPTSTLLKRLRVNFFPTVLFLNADLNPVAEPLVGLDQAGFYGAYLDQRLEHAKSAMRRAV